MNEFRTHPHPPTMPVENNLTATYVGSVGVGFLLALASAAGLLFPEYIYPTEELRRSFLANDVVNLIVGLPVLLVPIWLTWPRRTGARGRLLGLLLWPGGLFYVLYNALIYVIALPLNAGLLLALGQLALSIYTLAALVATIDGEAVRHRLRGAVPENLAGGTMMVSGLLFFLLAVGTTIGNILSGTAVDRTDLAVLVSDGIVSPAWVIVGLLLWRGRPLGYMAAGGLLFQLTSLFIGLIVVLLLEPLLSRAAVPLTDVLVVSVMALIVLVPLVLFVRGILKREA
jgi:hypothetical protein